MEWADATAAGEASDERSEPLESRLAALLLLASLTLSLVHAGRPTEQEARRRGETCAREANERTPRRTTRQWQQYGLGPLALSHSSQSGTRLLSRLITTIEQTTDVKWPPLDGDRRRMKAASGRRAATSWRLTQSSGVSLVTCAASLSTTFLATQSVLRCCIPVTHCCCAVLCVRVLVCCCYHHRRCCCHRRYSRCSLSSTRLGLAASSSFSSLVFSPPAIMSGAPKCGKCSKTVYDMEKQAYRGGFWHDFCFR